MTQRSQPAQDHVINFPTSDAGPYSADEWSDMFASLFSTDQADQGPLVRYLNELEVTLNVVGPPPEFRVDTGGAMSDGHWFKNDAVVDFTIPLPAGNERIDRVVVCVNNTAVAMTVSDLGFTLDFPDDLTDYNLTASIEPYSARLVIVQGLAAPGPAAPGLDQNANHFMIPLYQYEIDIAGAITGEVDQRVFCRFASGYGFEYPFAQVTQVYNTSGANIERISNEGGQLADGDTCIGICSLRIPTHYAGSYNAFAMIRPGATGNLRWTANLYRERCGEIDHPAAVTGPSTTAVTDDEWECLALSAQAVSAGDILTLRFERDGGNVLDTIGATVYLKGLLLTPLNSTLL